MNIAQSKLSAEETQMYAECKALIEKGPHTAAAIGEALWLIQEHHLYRSHFWDMKTFLNLTMKMDFEEGLKLIEDWKRTPRGRAATGTHPGHNTGEGAKAVIINKGSNSERPVI